MALVEKLQRFMERPAPERRIVLRLKIQDLVGFIRFRVFGAVAHGVTLTSFHPDSAWVYSEYPEFKELLPQWLQGNKLNNGGDLVRYYSLIMNIKQILRENIQGDFAELGVYLGNSAAVLAHFAASSNRLVFLFDTFEGFDKKDLVDVDAQKPLGFQNTSLDRVRENVRHEEACIYVKGHFPGSITQQASDRVYAFVHIDCDLYNPMRDALQFFYRRLSPGGALFLHDYSSVYWAGAHKAIDEFCSASGERAILLPDKSGTAVIRKRSSPLNV